MQLTRTTVRLDPPLKQAAQAFALRHDINFQTLFERALRKYLETYAKQTAKKIVFKTHDLGIDLDNLTREDLYVD